MTAGGETLVVTNKQFEKLKGDTIIQQQTIWEKQVGIDLVDSYQLKEVQRIYEETTNNGHFEMTK